MALTSQQRALLARVMATPDWKRASPRERKALIEAGLVESNLRNVNYGDRDSKGYLQQRPSQGWQNPTNIEQATRSFLTRAHASNTGHGSAGQLAQSVQRSAFPGRYDQRSGTANSILGGSPPASPTTSGTTTRTIPGVDRSAGRLAALEQYASQSGRPGSAVDLYLGLQNQQDTPSRSVTTTKSVRSPAAITTRKGVTHFDGQPVAGWIAPILKYARKHGWQGTVNSGFRSDTEQTRIYQSGVRPAALPQSMGGKGSNHEFTGYPGGAVDVSDASTLSRILQGSPYAGRLVWAGGKDPVHFSHPHGGSY